MSSSIWNDATASRRAVLQGIAAVAVVGITGIRFGMTEAFAAVNDKYPEDAFKQKSEADAIKSLYGKTVQGVIRSTFVVDEEGRVEVAQYNVKATGHVAKLRRDLGLA